MTAIAIVGMACRFAGAPDLQAYWQLTRTAKDAFGPIPPDRWDHEAFFSTNKRSIDKSYAPAGAFIDDIRSFPALALGIPPRRVEVMDPQQRFSIEVGLAAIEDAGYRPGAMPERTGVYMGVTASEFRQLLSSRIIASLMAGGALGEVTDPQAIADAVSHVVPPRPFSAPGVLANMISAAVAQELDLKGPAYTVDAACASALVAVYDAVTQLRAGTIDAAVAGGVYLCMTPEHHIAFSRIGAMSPSGVCRPFDDRADGFVQGDGAGVMVLKRLEDAVAAGDRIYAVIHGAAINNDGRGDGPMAPVQEGQTRVIRDAWRQSGIDPARVGYVETHGTGTLVGDVIEFNGLQDALGDRAERVWLGSSKANIGHTMSAAGIAGLIRAALAIHHKQIPPMAGFESPKPDLPLEDSPFAIPTDVIPWEAPDRAAGISSFGFGGTNGHIVMTAAPAPTAPAPTAQVELIRMSAPDEASLRALAGRTAAALLDEPDLSVAAVARAWSARPQQPARLALSAGRLSDLIEGLQTVAQGGLPKGASLGIAPKTAPRIGLLFPGQGAQRLGMLGALRQRFPVVGETLADLEDGMADLLPIPLTHLIYPELRAQPVSTAQAQEELTHTAHCQPALFACGHALWRLLQQVGLQPVVATGHSLGEFNAAVVAGVLDGHQAARFTAQRGAAMASVSGDPGTMAALLTDAQTAEALLVPGAVLANANHPRQVVVSGATEAVRQVMERAQATGVEAKALPVSHGFHSPVFADLDVDALVDALPLSDPQLPVASGIDPSPYADADAARAVFARHASSPVDFVGAVRQCVDAGADLLLQVGAGGPLASFARKIADAQVTVRTLASLDDADGGRSLLETLGWLWVRGASLDLDGLTAPSAPASLPPAELPREPYWPVKDRSQRALEVSNTTPRPTPQGAQTHSAAPAVADEPTQPSDDEVLQKVIEVVARVSSYPVHSVQPTMTLVDELGLDSLMVADMASGLADAFPGLGGLPQELLINQPTVADIADYIRGADRSANAEDDDAPLIAYKPVWREAPIELAGDLDLTGRAVSLEGPGAAALEAVLPIAVRRADDPNAAQVLIWVASTEEPVPVSAVLSGEHPWIDTAGPLIARLDALAKTGQRPDLILVRRADDPWSAALDGVVASVGREWPDALCRVVQIDALLPEIGPRLVRELDRSERSVHVRLTAHGRQVLGFEADDPREPLDLSGQTVLITGGTRGLGAKLAVALADEGQRVLVLGRSAPTSPELTRPEITPIQADVTDFDALSRALAPHQPIHAVIHAAGVLADGALGTVDPDVGAASRAVKGLGWLTALRAAGPELKVALGIGSWAGRFGNRHQAHYAAGNALLTALSAHGPRDARVVVGEFGPFTHSEMVQTIPAPIQAAMRAEGVDFVGDQAGLHALLDDLRQGSGPRVHGRRLPGSTRARIRTHTLSVQSHPFLADHAIDGVPVLPLAAAADLLAEVAGLPAPFEIRDLRLFTGITVKEPVTLLASIQGERAELRFAEKGTLAYRATLRPLTEDPALPEVLSGGDPSTLSVTDFYEGVTFHGPLLAGLLSIDGVGPDFARGQVRTGHPADWEPKTERPRFAVDPLALDSAMQLTATVAWTRFRRAGTPVSLGRWVQLHPFPEGPLTVEARFSQDTSEDSDRFAADFVFRDDQGTAVALAVDAVAELRRVQGEAPPLQIKPEWINPSVWKEVVDIKTRLELAGAAGISNPYFTVHEGTARDTTVVEGRELVNFSSYNYIGLSGDPRVLSQVKEAVDRYGTSVSASRVASGERPFHTELEAELAAAQGAEDALVFTAGHATNVTTIGHLMGKGDLVLHDELIHDSALQGIKLSGAARKGYRHEDPAHLEQLLQELRPHYEKVLIVIEGVYSMDGDLCDLPAFIELKKKYGCLLMVDEAHSFGIVGAGGRGIGEHFGIDGRDVDLWMGTLSKSLASCGGWISASKDLITYLRYTAPGFVYSAGLTPANGVAALASLRLMLEEPERVRKLQANAQLFHDALVRLGVDTGPAKGGSGVIPAVTGNSFHALMLSQRLLDQGINVQPIVYPAVADDAARLRFFLSSTHTEAQLLWTAERVAKTLEQVRLEHPI